MAESSDTVRNTTSPDHTTRFDQDNPLHLQNFNSPGMKLVSDCFDGTGFGNWKHCMTIALSARNKLGFVDGFITKPTVDSPMFKSCSMCNDMNWRKDMVLSEINQENSNVAEYFTKLKMLWDDIDALCFVPICTCGCECGAAKKTAEFHQNKRVIQFLMGLNDSYHVMRGSVLMRSPLPSLSQVYNIVLQEETQRGIHSSTTHFMTNTASLHAKDSSSSKFKPKSFSDNKFKSNLQCNYCKKSGHLIDICYRLHGFPNDFKFNKPKKFTANVDVSGSIGNSVQTNYADVNSNDLPYATPVSSPAGLTQDMYNQLVSLLKNVQPTHNTSSANFSGNSIDLPYVTCLSAFHNNVWIIDSGANNHMCNNKHMFNSSTSISQPIHISLPNGNVVVVNVKGSVLLPNKITLEYLLYVPSFSFNLLSVNKLTSQFKCQVHFFNEICYMQGSSLKRPLVLEIPVPSVPNDHSNDCDPNDDSEESDNVDNTSTTVSTQPRRYSRHSKSMSVKPAFAQNSTKKSVAKLACQQRCGSLVISYPFGENCSAFPSMEIYCDTSSKPAKAFSSGLFYFTGFDGPKKGLQVLNIYH
ncbi:hypothetical protein AgCh_037296 [Apium graveolens]